MAPQRGTTDPATCSARPSGCALPGSVATAGVDDDLIGERRKVGVTSQSIDSNEPIPESGMPVAKKTLAFRRFFLLGEVEANVDSEHFPLRPHLFDVLAA
jgi:hypothetical protein